MKQPQKWGIDIDGCLAVFDESYIELLNELAQDEAQATRLGKNFQHWDWPTAKGVLPETEKEAWGRISAPTSLFWQDLRAYPGVEGFLQTIETLYHEGRVLPYFITTRPGVKSKHQTERWLKSRGMSNPTVLICLGDKAPIINSLGLDIMIEDRPDAIVNLQERCPHTRIYCINRTWNQDIPATRRIDHVGLTLQLEAY